MSEIVIKYQAVLKKVGVKVEELPKNVQVLIKQINVKKEEYDDCADEELEPQIEEQIQALDESIIGGISDYVTDRDDAIEEQQRAKEKEKRIKEERELKAAEEAKQKKENKARADREEQERQKETAKKAQEAAEQARIEGEKIKAAEEAKQKEIDDLSALIAQIRKSALYPHVRLKNDEIKRRLIREGKIDANYNILVQ